MSDSRAAEVRTGLFVAVGVVIFAALSLWVAGVKPWGVETTRHRVLMPDAGGLRVGDPVRVAGVRVGRLVALELRADAQAPVVFGIELEEGTPVGRSSRAYFGSDSLLGSKFLALSPRSAEDSPIQDGDELRGERSPNLADAMGQFGDLVSRAKVLLDETSVLVRGMNQRIDPLLDRFEALASEDNARELTRTLELMRGVLEEAGPRLPSLLEQVEGALAKLDQGVEGVPAVTAEARGLLADLRSAVGPDGRRLAGLLDSADHTLVSASETLGAVTGSAGDLEAAMRDLRAAADNLEALTRSLGERPSRLILPSGREDRRPGEGIKP